MNIAMQRTLKRHTKQIKRYAQESRQTNYTTEDNPLEETKDQTKESKKSLSTKIIIRIDPENKKPQN